MGIARHALLWASRQRWIGEQFRRRKFARRATARFIPGEEVDAALNAAHLLEGDGITSLVSQLGENVTTTSEAEAVCRHYIDVLGQIERRGLTCHISLKPTQLGLDLSKDLCLDHLNSLLLRATTTGSFIWVDMEGSQYVDRTLDVFGQARRVHANVGVCIQSYLFRAADDLEHLITQEAAVRLVKGAYSEPADVAIQNKRENDSNFLMLADRMLDARTTGGGGLPVFGTHDTHLLTEIIENAATKGVGKSGFEIQMLYGIVREYQRTCASDGYRVRVLISYGAAWYPWYMRRLAERPANVWFVVRSIFKR